VTTQGRLHSAGTAAQSVGHSHNQADIMGRFGNRTSVRARVKFCNSIRSLFAGAIFLAIPIVPLIAAPPVVTVCGPSTIEVHHARDDVEAGLACAGAADAVEFLEPIGLVLPLRIRIELVTELPPELAPSAAGCYDVAGQRVLMPHLDHFLQNRTWFGVPATAELYRSVAAHESSHAIAVCHSRDHKLPLAAHEYVAYVTMLATMEEGSRDRVLDANPGTGFDHPMHINDLRFVLGPEQFGVESYRHWLKQPDPPGFLRRVLAGEVVLDPPM
jgi:hypothetical protein